MTDSTERWDWEKYWKRVRDFQNRINPLHLFVSDAEIEMSKQVVELGRLGKWFEVQKIDQRIINEESSGYSNAREIVSSTTNPTNGKTIPPLLRMSGFIPANIPICAGMLLAKPTVFNSVCWQWINQTYNAAFNYAQGNRSNDESNNIQSLLQGYGSAVLVSVGLCVGCNSWLKRAQLPSFLRSSLQAVVPWFAVCSANVANVALIRYPELKSGIPVRRKDGTAVGTSIDAAYIAIGQTALSRVVLATPVLLLPNPIIRSINFLAPATATSTFMKICTELGVLCGCLAVGLPMAVGLFHETQTISTKKLEKRFHNLKDENENEVNILLFDKGI